MVQADWVRIKTNESKIKFGICETKNTVPTLEIVACAFAILVHQKWGFRCPLQNYRLSVDKTNPTFQKSIPVLKCHQRLAL